MRAKGQGCKGHIPPDLYTEIPPDLYTEILIWLPVKSLMRFTCVSKSWQSLIKDSTFVTNHRQTSPSSRKRSLFVKRHFNSKYGSFKICMLPHYDSNDFKYECIEKMELEIPWVTSKNSRTLQRSNIPYFHTCHELVCVVYNDSSFILWNPSIRKFITLPKPNLGGRNIVGFGFNPKTNDYNVVRSLEGNNRVEIFSLNNGSWRDIDYTIPCFPKNSLFVKRHDNMCINGVIYWIREEFRPDDFLQYRPCDFLRYILGFSLIDEEFRQISLPIGLRNGIRRTLELAELRESICLIQYMHGFGLAKKQLCSVWVMEEPSGFVKLMTISNPERVGRDLCLKENGEILRACVERILYSYDLRTSQLRPCGCLFIERCSLQLSTYVESLVLL